MSHTRPRLPVQLHHAALFVGAGMLAGFLFTLNEGHPMHDASSEPASIDARTISETELHAAQAGDDAKSQVMKMVNACKDAHQLLYDATEAFRPDLYRYCLRLTGSPWDAEDLVQESYSRAVKVLGESHGGIEAPKAYLFRMATNLWIDQLRRYKPEALGDDLVDAKSDDLPELNDEVRAALEQVCLNLNGRERACFLLADSFSFPHKDVAALMGTSVGAIKVTLHRARKKLEGAKAPKPANTPALNPSAELVDAFVAAFNKRDLAALVALMDDRSETEILGMVSGLGKGMNKNVQEHTLPDPSLLRAEKKVYRGETIVLLWYSVDDADGKSKPVVRDIVRLEGEGTTCTRMRFYYFAADTLKAVCEELGVACVPNGYHF